MNPLADIVLKVSLILSTAIGLSMALRGKSAALRHWVLSVGIVCAVTAPLLVSVAPVWHAPIGAKVARPPQNVPLMASPSERRRGDRSKREGVAATGKPPGQSARLPSGSC